MKYIVGGYAASPRMEHWNPALEAPFWEALRNLPLIGGLEIPYYEHLHKFDEAFLLNNLSPDWSNVITMVPGTMDRLEKDPLFGLASPDENKRKAAVAYVTGAFEAVIRLNHKVGRRAVRAVEIHSAPSMNGSHEAFTKSISECAAWDWQGAQLLVEHCDAALPSHPPAKGFLKLEQEIEAILDSRASSTPVGVLINWGRSAIEGRGPSLPLEHVQQAKEAGLLKGLIFSGAAFQDPHHADWRDSHAPFATSDAPLFGAPGSILTREQVNACVEMADPARDFILGLKMQPLPNTTSLEDRIGLIKEALEIVDECVCQIY